MLSFIGRPQSSSHFFWLDSGVKLLLLISFLYIIVVAFLTCRILVVSGSYSWSVFCKSWNLESVRRDFTADINPWKLRGRGSISYLQWKSFNERKLLSGPKRCFTRVIPLVNQFFKKTVFWLSLLGCYAKVVDPESDLSMLFQVQS